MERKVINLFVIILLVSCSYTPKHMLILQKFNKELTTDIVQWDNIKISKYKKNIIYSTSIYPAAKDVYGYCGVFLFLELNEDDFKTLEYELNKNVIYKSNVKDVCNLYITGVEKIDLKLKSIPPVPSLNNIKSPLCESNYAFSEDSYFLVNQFYKGVFLNKEAHTIEKELLSKAINYNGSSVGTLIDKKNRVIVLWGLVW